MIRRLRKRLSETGGMTLVELLVSVSIGMVVVLAAGNLLDASGRASAEVQDRVDAVQRGRVAMEQISQRLRSQVCLNVNTPAIAYADSNEMRFYTELGPLTSTFSPQARRLRYEAGANGANGSLTESVWDTVMIGPNPQATESATFGRPPDRTRTVIGDIALAKDIDDRDGDGNRNEILPLLRYFKFLVGDPSTPSYALQSPLVAADMERVVRIIVNFDARPTRGPLSRNKLDTRFESDIFVRTADPTDPTNSPSCL